MKTYYYTSHIQLGHYDDVFKALHDIMRQIRDTKELKHSEIKAINITRRKNPIKNGGQEWTVNVTFLPNEEARA